VTNETLEILTNREIIAINQDPVVGTGVTPFRWGINVNGLKWSINSGKLKEY
jgi:alpha-galactosidase